VVKQGGPGKGLPLTLKAHHDFQLLERTMQPTLPVPLPEDFAAWGGTPMASLPSTSFVRTPDIEGSQSTLRDRRRLNVI
jgi:hypothetical protein